MIAKQFRQLNVYCRHLYFMTTDHDINCYVFKYRECILMTVPAGSQVSDRFPLGYLFGHLGDLDDQNKCFIAYPLTQGCRYHKL